MAESDFKWYVLKAISGKEGKVKEYIEAAQKTSALGELVMQVLIPTEKVVTLKNGKRNIKDRVMLPGYVLVEANLTDECYPLLRNVPNVLGFLSDGKSIKPTPVRQSEVNRILGKIDEEVIPDVEEFPFLVGEKVKVTDGPFSGFVGLITEILTDKKKLRVEVVIFGRNTPLELSFNQVDKE